MNLGLVRQPVVVSRPVTGMALLVLDGGMDWQLAATCWKLIHVRVVVLVLPYCYFSEVEL
jgi:hypothetical protein